MTASCVSSPRRGGIGLSQTVREKDRLAREKEKQNEMDLVGNSETKVEVDEGSPSWGNFPASWITAFFFFQFQFPSHLSIVRKSDYFDCRP